MSVRQRLAKMHYLYLIVAPNVGRIVFDTCYMQN